MAALRWSSYALASLVLAIALAAKGWAAERSPVHFDVPAIAIAEPLDPSVSVRPTAGGTLLRLKLTVSTLIDPQYRGSVDEVVIAIDSPQRSLRVLDVWPKTELYSQVDGTIAVQNQAQKNQNFAFTVAGGYEPFVRGHADGDYRSQQQLSENYQRRPPMTLLTSSGTVSRGYGAFFKFRPGPTPVLEGDRELALLVEAPHGWRADLLHVSVQASGLTGDGFGGQEPRLLASAQLWMAVHRLGDSQAAQAAQRYMQTEQAVRHMAASSQAAIEKRSLPTVFHKVGAALDVVAPKIPATYLDDILFNLNQTYFDSATSKLPVDLRVAALDYWDQRSHLLAMGKE